MSIFEYDEEKHMKSEREEWRKIGREEVQRILSDSVYREQLYQEYFPKDN